MTIVTPQQALEAVAARLRHPVRLERFDDVEFDDQGGAHRMFGTAVEIAAGAYQGVSCEFWDHDKKPVLGVDARTAFADLLGVDVSASGAAQIDGFFETLRALRFAVIRDGLSLPESIYPGSALGM